MSWRSYEILTFQPDFTTAPEQGLGESGMTTVEFSQAAAWGIWHGDTALALSFTWRFETASEQRILRELMNTLGGRSMPFFMPSWAKDFTLETSASIGDRTIRIEAAGLVDIEENRPDTDGRQIFLAGPDGSFQAVGVVGVEEDGDVEILSLDFPLAYDFDVRTAIVGKTRMVRLADDRIEYRQDRPGHGSVVLRMVTSRQTRRVNENPSLESEAQFSLKRFEDLVATDENPILTNFQSPATVGPTIYGTSQTDNFFREWSGQAVAGGFAMFNSGGGGVIMSTLFDSTALADHVTFAFDAGGRESIAWNIGEGRIRIGYKAGGTDHWRDIDGISPVMFQTWTIDGTVSAGDADLVLFYIREGFSGIFARFYREDFATERLIARSPAAPIYLQFARRLEGRIEVVGMDSGHRRCRWRTLGYLTPPELQVGTLSITPEITGTYRSVVAFTSGEDNGTLSITPEITGTYRSVVAFTSGEEAGGIFKLASTISGEYKLVAKLTPAQDNGNLSINPIITGTYAPV